MTLVRRDIWRLSTAARPWHPNVVAYANAIKAMQALPDTNPRSWAYQAAIHGRAGVVPPRGAPWNECQHATWYFLPWHRMYLYQFERIVRSFVDAAGGPTDWTLPFWDYSRGAPGNALPPAFRQARMPDNSANPLLVSRRRASVNAGTAMPAAVVRTDTALARTFFTNAGAATGFGGPQTGFAHQGPAFGEVEALPHGPVHVQVGGNGGLMTDPDLAALDPIFWLHHSNIDRLWDVWRRQRAANVNPTTQTWLSRSFRLRDAAGASVTMRVRDVLDDVAQLDYTYEGLPAPPRAPAPGGRIGLTVSAPPSRKKPVMVGRNERGLALGPSGGSTEVPVGPLPRRRGRAGLQAEKPRMHLDLADIEGTKNPGVVYGVYLNLPAGAAGDERDDHLAGVVSFFGIEQAGTAEAAPTGRDAHPIRYSFDVTDTVDRLQAKGVWDPSRLTVDLLPVEGSEPEDDADAEIRVGSVSLYAG